MLGAADAPDEVHPVVAAGPAQSGGENWNAKGDHTLCQHDFLRIQPLLRELVEKYLSRIESLLQHQEQRLVVSNHVQEIELRWNPERIPPLQVLQSQTIIPHLELAKSQQCPGRAGLRIHLNQPLQDRPRRRVIIHVVQDRAQQPPAVPPLRTRLERFVEHADRVEIAVLANGCVHPLREFL